MHRLTTASLSLLTLAAASVGTANAAFTSRVPDAFVNADFVPAARVDTGNPALGFVTYTITNIALSGDYKFIDASPARIEADYTAKPVLTFYESATSSVPTGSVVLNGQFSVSVPDTGYGLFAGTYNFALTSSTASGAIGGLPVQVRLVPLLASNGTATIAAGPNDGFTVNTSISQFSEFSLDGGLTFVPLPPIQSSGVQAVPEPASLAAVALGSLTLLRRRRASSHHV